MTTVTYCRDSGKLANEWCEKDIRGSRLLTAELATEDVPTEVCDCHVGAEICGETGKLATGYCDPNHVEMVGLLSIKREYPYGQIEIGDQQYCLPYLVTTEGMFAAQNATFGICTVHNAQNNANHGTATPEPDPDEGTQPDEDSGGIGGWFNGLLGDLFG